MEEHSITIITFKKCSLNLKLCVRFLYLQNPKSLYFHVEKLRTITGKKQLFNGEIICSVDGVYNTLLRVLAGQVS